MKCSKCLTNDAVCAVKSGILIQMLCNRCAIQVENELIIKGALDEKGQD